MLVNGADNNKMLLIEELFKERNRVRIFKSLTKYKFWDKKDISVVPCLLGPTSEASSSKSVVVLIPSEVRGASPFEVSVKLKLQNFGSLKRKVLGSFLRNDLGKHYG